MLVAYHSHTFDCRRLRSKGPTATTGTRHAHRFRDCAAIPKAQDQGISKPSKEVR